MYKIVLFVVSFLLCLFGLYYCICYLNLLTIGYNFLDYVKFIISRFECVLLFVGLISAIVILILKGVKKWNIFMIF